MFKFKVTVMLVILPIFIKAQSITLEGRIKDKENRPVDAVSVTVSELKTGSISDEHGAYSIKNLKAKSYHIRFSKIGYIKVTKVISIEELTKPLEVTMEIDNSMLSEVQISDITQAQAEVKALKRSVVPVTVLTAKDIENRASNLNEMLARQAGVQIRQTGGIGSETRISIRGLEGKRVQIFIEGNPLNTPDGSIGINDIPLQLIERIEIYKGIVPAWLGGDGLGGAVNIVIKHQDISYLDVNLTRESFNTNQASVLGKKTFDKVGIETGLGFFYTGAANNYIMDSPYESGLKIRRDHDKYISTIAGGNIKFHKLWFDEIELEAIYTYNYKQTQGVQRNIQHAETKANATVIDLGLKKEHYLNGKLDFRYNLIYAGFNNRFADTSRYMYNWNGSRYLSTIGRGEIGIGPNLTTTIQNEVRHRFNLNYKLTPHSSLNFNNTFRSSNSKPNDDVANAAAAPGKNFFNYPGRLFNSVTGFTSESDLLNNRLLITVAAKHYYNDVHGFNTSIYTSTPDEVHNRISKFGYNAGLRFNFTDAFLLKGSYEKNVRMPLPTELFGDGALITPSISLLPEMAKNTSIGLLYDKTDKSPRRLQLECNMFYMRVNNLIQLAGNVLTSGYVNYQKAAIKGADAEVKYDFTASIYASANSTYQKINDINKYIPGTKNVPNPTYGLQIPNIPSFFSNWNLEYHRDNLLANNTRTRIIYEGTYVGKFNYAFPVSNYEDLSIPAYVSHNLAWEQSFQRNRYTVTLEAHNITGSKIISNYNNPLPGSSWRIKIRCLLLGKGQ